MKNYTEIEAVLKHEIVFLKVQVPSVQVIFHLNVIPIKLMPLITQSVSITTQHTVWTLRWISQHWLGPSGLVAH